MIRKTSSSRRRRSSTTYLPKKSKNKEEHRPEFQEWQIVDADGVPDASTASTSRDGSVRETDRTGAATVGCSTLIRKNEIIRDSFATGH